MLSDKKFKEELISDNKFKLYFKEVVEKAKKEIGTETVGEATLSRIYHTLADIGRDSKVIKES